MNLTLHKLRALPKIELHRHLDGSIRQDTLADLAQRHAIDLGVSSERELLQKTKIRSPMRDLKEVLSCFWVIQRVLCCYEAIRRVAFENVEDAYRDGVKLVELRFAPTFIAENKALEYDEIIEGVLDGVSRGLDTYDIQVGLIHIVPRSLALKRCELATQEVLRYRRSSHRNADRIVGFDLADSESETDPEDFLPQVEMAREAGLGITVHSGEDTDAEAVRRSIEVLGAERIGHGIRIWGHEEVMELVRYREVLLEVCPTSNWLTNSVTSLEEHPLPKLYRAGIPISINSDDPHLMDIDLVREYEIANRVWGLGLEDFQRINEMALSKSFLDDEIKKRVQSQLA